MTDSTEVVDEPIQAPSTPEPPGRLDHYVQYGVRALPTVRRTPITIGYVVVLWALGLATGSFVNGPSESLASHVEVGVPALRDGQWWTLLTSALWCGSWASYLISTVVIVALGVPAERRLGPRSCALMLVLTQALGVLVGVGFIRLGEAVGSDWLASVATENGAVAVAPFVGLAMAASNRAGAMWRRRVRIVVLTVVVVLALFLGSVSNVLTLGAALVGLVAGLLLLTEAGRAARVAASNVEARILVGLFVAASALGPVVAAIAPSESGPLAAYREQVVSQAPSAEQLQSVCSQPELSGLCRELASERAYDAGPALLMTLVPALVLLILAEGLRRGRRFAWWAAVAVNALLVGQLSWNLVDTIRQFHDADVSVPDYVWQAEIQGIVLPAFVLAVLVVTRRRFTLALQPRSLYRLLAVVVGTFVAVSIAYLAVGWILRDQFFPEPSFGQLLVDLPKRFFPPVYMETFGASFVPQGRGARFIYEYPPLLFWLVALAGLAVTFRRTNYENPARAVEARDILFKRGGESMSYMATWPGNQYWINDAGTAAFGFRVIATVAITVGDPFGRPEDREAAVGEFAEYCDRNGWTPCFYSVTDEVKQQTDAMGWKSVQVAEETIIRLGDLAFAGKKWQDVRTALNKAAKAGIKGEWWSYPEAPLNIKDQVRAMSEEWVADKGLPEMGFTLGGLEELDDPLVRCLVAIDAEGVVHGVTSWMPVYRDGKAVGWTLDFMRRKGDGFRNVMDFLIASSVLGLQEQGAQFASLSGAPMARVERDDVEDEPLQRLLDVLGKVLEPVYGFRSLLAFKAKFQPEYRPIFMCYPDNTALPSIANSISKAYLPHMTPAQTVRLVRSIV